MNILIYFIIFMITSTCVERIIEKTNFHVMVINKFKKYKHFKNFLFIALIIIGFMTELGKQSLNEKFGKHNIPSLILGAIMFAIYLKFLPYVFSKKRIDLL